MVRVAAVGRAVAVSGYALAGVLVLVAEDDDAVLAAWDHLPADVEVVILSSAARQALGAACETGHPPFTVVMPS